MRAIRVAHREEQRSAQECVPDGAAPRRKRLAAVVVISLFVGITSIQPAHAEKPPAKPAGRSAASEHGSNARVAPPKSVSAQVPPEHPDTVVASARNQADARGRVWVNAPSSVPEYGTLAQVANTAPLHPPEYAANQRVPAARHQPASRFNAGGYARTSVANAASGPQPPVIVAFRFHDSPAPTRELSGDLITRPPSIGALVRTAEQPDGQEQLSSAISEAGHSWFFGGGVGQTMLNVGTVAIFPPYALYLLGNAGLALAGYDPIYITDAIPEPAKDKVVDTHRVFTEIPGRVNALVLGEEFVRGTNGTHTQ